MINTKIALPHLLQHIPDKPKQFYLRGTWPGDHYTYITIVGSRKYTAYGRQACEHIINGLANLPVVIVSGLAFGIDTIAHQAAMANNLKTIAVPGSGLNDKVIYPAKNLHMAHQILTQGGALVSEYQPDFKTTVWSLPKRNRIMAAISHATIVIEAAVKSGTMITATLAMDYNREVMAVPGSIFSQQSAGTHHLIKNGATPIRSGYEVAQALGINTDDQPTLPLDNCTDIEKNILTILANPTPKSELLRSFDMPFHEINATLTALELKGFIYETLGKIHRK